MWSEELRNNLSKELELQLDNKNFFDAKAYYASLPKEAKKASCESLSNSSNIGYAKTFKTQDYNYETAIKGISFSNKVEVEKKQISVDNLSFEDRKIYKISDLLAANLAETIVIPYNVQSVSLALIKKFDWRDVLFSDVGTAIGMIKNKLKIR